MVAYLACPYSDPSPDVRERRYRQVNSVAAFLMRRGLFVFSPISHCHDMAKQNDLPTDFEYWRGFNEAFLSVCSDLCVLKLPGWKESEGVTWEIAFAKSIGIPVSYIDPKIAFWTAGSPVMVDIEFGSDDSNDYKSHA